MIGMKHTAVFDTAKMKAAADRSVFESVNAAAMEVGKTARASVRTKVKKNRKASRPGQPPRTKGGLRGLRRAIRTGYVDKETRVVGPAYSIFGNAGHVLEFGGKRGNTVMQARPFMGPALEANLDRFANKFVGSFRE